MQNTLNSLSERLGTMKRFNEGTLLDTKPLSYETFNIIDYNYNLTKYLECKYIDNVLESLEKDSTPVFISNLYRIIVSDLRKLAYVTGTISEREKMEIVARQNINKYILRMIDEDDSIYFESIDVLLDILQ